MLNRIVLSAALLGCALAADNPPREVVYRSMDPCRQGGCLSPVFDKGYFFQMKDYVGAPPDGYALWGPDGNPLYQVNVIAPDGTPGHLRQDAAIDTDGTAIVPISYGGYGGKGNVKGGGIVVLDRDGKQTLFIDTGRWLPQHVCFTKDHSIWVMGVQYAPLLKGDDKDHVDRGDYDMIRKYSRNGKLAGEFLPRSLFAAGLTPVENGWIHGAGDRVGVLTHPGMSANAPEWIELDFEGRTIGRWKLGPQLTVDGVTHSERYYLGRLAFTADARLFAQPHDVVLKKYRLLILDRATSSWKASDAGGGLPAHTYLVGADGNNLAFENRIDGGYVMWVRLAQSH